MGVESLIFQGLWGLISIVLVEILRDLYHVASHGWEPLQRLHSWHHRAYKKDFTPVNGEIYRRSQLYNDAPEALFMLVSIGAIAFLTHHPALWLGGLYATGFLLAALLRSQGWLYASDLTHEPGPLTELPHPWRVNRTYHWRHHFDQTNAYYAGHFTITDKVMGTALSLKGKTVAVTGASGTLGRALIRELARQGAKPIGLSTSADTEIEGAVSVVSWQVGAEAKLADRLQKVDILIINHGLNVHSDRTPTAIEKSLEVNALSAWRLLEVFLSTVDDDTGRATKEVWVNTSEAEVNPAFSPLYEVSKRLLGDLVNLRRTDAPCVIRKLVLGPFKSNLNPIGVMSADWVAGAIVALAKRDFRNIVVTINPLTYLLFPLKELGQTIYFKLFTKAQSPAPPSCR
ncbi:bifunctional sterol desaturase/short chain dehydrogenase [Romeria aff. gracilis LEGE 07310]|uniref:Bifunctional sterol desaturase/short chain dehydrogenase n=1 Tax=Vasconcelosia minhoensis LEGE 07310 TaxID=915328 RepID=A0A8J7DRV7_9CYAN|nr:bifunctional sterol desaturase/short chain dehydrogenase [Romeria gracilis]MBE9079399.1 bifunctional sterol desaturase/short chain dehydrogenase [Romeria aff. gracilis LEGE 07310]